MSLTEFEISKNDDTNLKIVSFNLLVQCYAGSNQPIDRTCLQDSYRFTLLTKLLKREIEDKAIQNAKDKSRARKP